MKKLFIAVPVLFGLMFAFVYFTNNDTEKSPAEIEQINFYQKYNKPLNTHFTIDSIDYSFNNFYYEEFEDSLTLKVFFLMKNVTKHEVSINRQFYKLQVSDEVTPTYYYPNNYVPSSIMDSTKTYFKYKLPARKLPYSNYQLLLESEKDSNSKAIVKFFKSYRAEG